MVSSSQWGDRRKYWQVFSFCCISAYHWSQFRKKLPMVKTDKLQPVLSLCMSFLQKLNAWNQNIFPNLIHMYWGWNVQASTWCTRICNSSSIIVRVKMICIIMCLLTIQLNFMIMIRKKVWRKGGKSIKGLCCICIIIGSELHI